MKTTKLLKGSALLLTLGLTFASCTKDKDDSTSAAENHAMSEQTNDDMDAIADEAEAGKVSSFKTETTGGILGDTVLIVKVSSGDTVNITVDFGTTGVTCKDGKVRKGKIKITRIGNPWVANSVRTATTDGYYVNNNKVEATRTVTFNGMYATNNHPSWNISATFTITLSDGSTISGSTTRLREWSEGSTTPFDRTDDVFVVSGTASGTKADGTAVNVEITTPLTFKVACHQIVSGVIKITPEGKETRTVDFGTGDCDDSVTVTVGKKSKTFTAKK
ncbi:MAG: hypothetical protein ACKOXB_05680 [Flavobacteriales bacterium]